LIKNVRGRTDLNDVTCTTTASKVTNYDDIEICILLLEVRPELPEGITMFLFTYLP